MIFEQLNLEPALLRAVREKGYEKATPIQAAIIPALRKGEDLIGQSQTGTGKTAAFVLPTLEKIDAELAAVQVLVMTPTRELALQVAGEFQSLSAYLPGVRTVALFGGDPIQRQIFLMKKAPQVVVGTPGRLMDHLRRRTLKLHHLHTVILDEADEMLRMGFREDMEVILGQIHTETQRLLFSATMPKAILDISHRYLKQPRHIQMQQALTTPNITQQYVAIHRKDKREALQRILEAEQPNRCLIFCNTKKMVEELGTELNRDGFMTLMIHGDLPQTQRQRQLKEFNQHEGVLLIATDVAARGLDMEEVDLVINFDVPDMEEFYVHRIGRSGRAGRKGRAITLITKRDHEKFKAIEHYMDQRVELVKVPSSGNVRQKREDQLIQQMLPGLRSDALMQMEDLVKRFEKLGFSAEQLAAALLLEKLPMVKEGRDLNERAPFAKQKPGNFPKKKRFPKNKKRRSR